MKKGKGITSLENTLKRVALFLENSRLRPELDTIQKWYMGSRDAKLRSAKEMRGLC
jgi:hypothetical protein